MFVWKLENNKSKYVTEIANTRIDLFDKFKNDIAKIITEKFGDLIVIPYGTVDWLSRNYPIIILKDPSKIRQIVEF